MPKIDPSTGLIKMLPHQVKVGFYQDNATMELQINDTIHYLNVKEARYIADLLNLTADQMDPA